ncbi:MAG: glutathione S-transferase C-terminal domain-containing protein [Proteobacteria bacterium]|nr:glutathione S-transferase C-terminal domain-containing protein [Pseudomonadota bacterium]
MMLTIIDYGSGNLHSAAKAFERMNAETGARRTIKVTADPDEVRRADAVVLPGVGAFADCRTGLLAVEGMMEAEAHLLSAMFNLVTRPEEQRDTAAGEKAVEALQKPLGVLNGALRGRPYLLGEKFSVADLNLAAIFAWAKVARLDLSAYPEAANWLNTCLARDGWRKLFPKNK